MTGPMDRIGQWLRNEQVPAVNSHMEMHVLLGDAYCSSYYEAEVGASGTVDMLLIPATGSVEAHIFRQFSTQSDVLIYCGETFTVTNSGTLCPANNLRRSAQGVNTPTMLVYAQPTLTGVTLPGGPQYHPGGNTKDAQGSRRTDTWPISMAPGVPHVIRVLNNSKIDTNVGVEIFWYEDQIKDPVHAG